VEDKLLVECDDKTYAISMADLAKYEVTDDATRADLDAAKQEAMAEGDVDADAEVVGFLRRQPGIRGTYIIRR